MPNRDCGTCTACCEGWLRSTVTDMYPGKPCQHCTAQGCAIYESRPEDPCKLFSCGWLKDDSPLPEDMRPDKSGVIVLFDRKWEGWQVIKAIPVGPSIPEPSQRWLMQYAQSISRPLILASRLRKDDRYVAITLNGFGPPAFREAVKNEIGPNDVSHADDINQM